MSALIHARTLSVTSTDSVAASLMLRCRLFSAHSL